MASEIRRLGFTLAFALAVVGCEDACSCDFSCDPEWSFGWDMGPPRDLPWPEDFGPDGEGDRPDARPPVCVTGQPCTLAEGCSSASAVCIAPESFGTVGIGGSDDPIEGHPGGPSTFVPTPLFPGGYCTTSWPIGTVSPSVCNLRVPAWEDEVCGDCAKCIDIFGTDSEETADEDATGFCAQPCEPSVVGNECRRGYECMLSLEVCFPGCQVDDECRITREESNGLMGIQSPATCERDPGACTPADCGSATPEDPDACADPLTNFDGLVYDTESRATCDPSTSRCVGRPSDPSAAGGDSCTDDRQCEPGGYCARETAGGDWLGGACSKLRCDLPENECANGGVCQRAGDPGVFGCFEGCVVGGVAPGTEPAALVAEGSARSTCREGYGCQWGGLLGAGETDNGVCLPVEYEASVTVPNIGAPCAADVDCYSPFGAGTCIMLPEFPAGYCSVSNCDAPWFTGEDADLCGGGAECLVFDSEDPTFSFCMQTCADASECNPGLGCIPVSDTSSACWLGCVEDADCRDGEVCSDPGTIDSVCVPE